MNHADYLAAPGIGSSALSALARSPWHYWAEYINPDRPERVATAAMSAGTLAHCAILEPAEFSARYIVRPDGLDMRTKEGKAWAASLPPGAETITAEQQRAAAGQRDAVLAVPELAALLAAGEAEVSVFACGPAGVWCKARPDWVHPLADGRVLLFDLKTTPDPAPDEFARSVVRYGYHRQAAHYVATYEAATGVAVAGFVFGAVSNAYPFFAVPIMLDDEAMERGARERDLLLRRCAACVAANDWPRPSAGMQLLSLPAWAKEIE